jgi:transglutaminase-like putative cysteine protease
LRGRAALAAFLGSLLALCLAGGAAGEETALYRASGPDAGLFDQYDNDGYSLAVEAAADGSLELSVRVSDAPLESRAPFPTGLLRDSTLPEAPERDRFAGELAAGARTQVQAVERVLLGIAGAVRYDPDRRRRQDPAAVFASRRANCVGFAELAVDLLRRAGIRTRTVQGILRTAPGSEGHEPGIGGTYHRWIEVYYPDRGYVFSDPWTAINGVDARYVPFRARALHRPNALALVSLGSSGRLAYATVRVGGTAVRIRRAGAPGR